MNSKFIESGFGLSLSISFNDKGLSMQSTDVDEEQLKAVLVDFRPFILKEESVYLPKIFNLIETINPKVKILNMEREIRANRKRDLKRGFYSNST